MTTIPRTAATSREAPAGAVRGRPAGQNAHANGNGRRKSGLVDRLIERVFAHEREYAHFGHMVTADGLRNFVFAADDGDGPTDPVAVFKGLRWGGQYGFASTSRGRVREVAAAFRATGGFDVETAEESFTYPRVWLPWFGRRVHYFVARKTQLILPGEFTDRFTYSVELARHSRPQDEAHVVVKRVPTVEQVVARLRSKFPDAAAEVLEKRARKFSEKIFPTFLTREAAILMILQEHLPSRYATRVPRIISLEKDIRGFVTELRMNWLRNGGQPLSQLEFAMQAADLLRAVHDSAQVIHLDLRLDNMVITEHGVGFVDFGSAVRVGEDLSKNPLLGTLFDELMRTSHIQKMLFSMTQSGQVTSQHLATKHGKVDKAIDLFYLALQFTTPHGNPDLAGLIHHEPEGAQAREIGKLSAAVLRPEKPDEPVYRSAKDVLRALELVEEKLRR